uniref:Uncharacterized protein n=1 Tax=Sciurus vulgaris TaxID=55149 RepID=A0A8D2AXF6_SCIVU
MVNEYKKIVLLIGLEAINDYHFRLIKSLLAKDLKLTRNMQDDYDRIRIADLMEEKFQNDAGLRKLIAVCRDIPALADLAETLEKRRLKVKRKSKGERKSTVKKGQQDEPTTAPSTSATKPDSEPESKEEIPSLKENKIKKSEDPERMQLPREQSQSLAPSGTSKQKTEGCPQTPHGHPPTPFSSPPIKNRRLTTIPKEASKECGYQKGPKEVMVLKATESFTYEFKECEKRMFHATVATESQFFRVKVFDISLKDKFIPRKVIAISDYIGRNGFLEIYSASSVSDVSANRKMEISYRLVQIANGTPKIEYLCSQCTVKYVNGVYTVYKKNVREDCTYYEIQDNTGKMEVVVHGRLIYINCEEGDKLKLFCFELAFNEDKWQLRSVKHSYIKVGILRELNSESLKILYILS